MWFAELLGNPGEKKGMRFGFKEVKMRRRYKSNLLKIDKIINHSSSCSLAHSFIHWCVIKIRWSLKICSTTNENFVQSPHIPPSFHVKNESFRVLLLIKSIFFLLCPSKVNKKIIYWRSKSQSKLNRIYLVAMTATKSVWRSSITIAEACKF